MSEKVNSSSDLTSADLTKEPRSTNSPVHFHFDHIAQQVPDIGEAISWYLSLFPQATVLHQDDSWGLIEAAGTRLAFVRADQHPSHLAWSVSASELEQLATQFQRSIVTHRDKTRSFYLEAPGNHWIEIICLEGATWANLDK